jgi:niacin transporter
MKARELALGGLFTAFSLLIPLVFGPYLRIVAGPFSATLASHVPLFLGALVSPMAAAMVGAASALGFLITMGPLIAARALSHIVLGLVAALIIRKGKPFYLALLAVLPIHAGLEALVVIPFGFSVYDWGVVVGIGTALHHLVDGAMAAAVARVLGLQRLSTWASAN